MSTHLASSLPCSGSCRGGRHPRVPAQRAGHPAVQVRGRGLRAGGSRSVGWGMRWGRGEGCRLAWRLARGRVGCRGAPRAATGAGRTRSALLAACLLPPTRPHPTPAPTHSRPAPQRGAQPAAEPGGDGLPDGAAAGHARAGGWRARARGAEAVGGLSASSQPRVLDTAWPRGPLLSAEPPSGVQRTRQAATTPLRSCLPQGLHP